MTMETVEKTTRAEHLAWCKRRALDYLPHDPQQAFASMSSDLSKHEGTRNHAGLEMGLGLLMSGNLEHPAEMQKFIEGFN